MVSSLKIYIYTYTFISVLKCKIFRLQSSFLTTMVNVSFLYRTLNWSIICSTPDNASVRWNTTLLRITTLNFFQLRSCRWARSVQDLEIQKSKMFYYNTWENNLYIVICRLSNDFIWNLFMSNVHDTHFVFNFNY